MTDEEKQSITSAVLSAIKTNSKTIDQLTAVSELSDSDSFEVSGGKRITYGVLRSLLAALFNADNDTLLAKIDLKELKSVMVTATDTAATITITNAGGKAVSCSVPVATDKQAGLITSTDKVKLDSAYNNANSALERAAVAKNTADTASASASAAGKTADNAQTAANAAKTVAEDAQQTAIAAKDAAEKAQTSSDSFKSDLVSQTISGASMVGYKGVDVRHEDRKNAAIKIELAQPKTVEAELDDLHKRAYANGYAIDELEESITPRLFFNGNTLVGKNGGTLTLEQFVALTAAPASSSTTVEVRPDLYGYVRKQGVVVTLYTPDGLKSYQWKGTAWDDTSDWEQFGGSAAVGNCYNVTNEVPVSGYYDLASAVKTTLTKGKAACGMQVTFAVAKNTWKTYQYVGADTAEVNFTDTSLWIDLAGMQSGREEIINVNDLCGEPSSGYYTLALAIGALVTLQDTTNITYAKPGLVITYKTAERKWETKQFTGEVSDFGQTGLWVDFGGGSSTEVKTSDTPANGGTDAFSTGGAYKSVPTGMKIDTETEGTVKLGLVNAAGDAVGDEVQFTVGTGSGGGGTVVSMVFQQSPLYGNAGSDIIARAAIRSITTSGTVETANNIESVALIDRDTKQTLETWKVNQGSSADLETYDFTFDLTSYFAKAGTRRFQFVVSDDAGNSGTRNLNVTAVDVTISSVQTLNYTESTALTEGGGAKAIPMYKFANNASDKGILCVGEIYVDGTWKELGRATITDTYSHSVTIDPAALGLSHGTYPLRFHGTDVASGVEGNWLHTSIMVINADSQKPVVSTRWLSDDKDAKVRLYETILMDFAVYTPGKTSSAATVRYGTGTALAAVATQECQAGTTYTFSRKVADVACDGTVTENVQVTSGESVSQTAQFIVSGTLIAVSDVAGAEFALDFAGRSNAESEHTITDRGVNLIMENCNWSTTGFVKDSFGTNQYGTDGDTGVTALRIAENAKGTLSYKPFNDASIETNGMALQFTMRKRNMADDNAVLISCISGGVGFYVTGKQVVFTTDGNTTVAHSIVAALKDDDMTNVTIVIEPSSRAPYSGIGAVKMYFDGDEIGACYYESGALAKHETPVTFDGTDGELYLYNFKAWKTWFNFEQAFNSYLLKMSDTDAMITEYEFNNVMASQTAENTTKDRPQMQLLLDLGIPCFVLCKNPDTADNEAKDNYPEYLEGLDGDKKTTRVLDVYAYFPQRPWQNFKATGVVVSNQGTTSSKRPIKNIKMKFKKCQGIELLTARTDYTSEADLAKYDECAANAAAKKVQVYDNSLPTNIITVKVDYSESGGANNGASTNLYNDLQKVMGANYMTPAQVYYTGKYNLNTSIDSIPCAFFRTDRYSSDATSPSYGYFHAKGNWNCDKGDAAFYGFEKCPGYNKGCLNYGDFYELVAAKGQSLDDFAKTQNQSAWEFYQDEEKTSRWEVVVLSEFCGPAHKIYRLQADGSWKETTGTMRFTDGKWSITGDVVNPVENYELLKYDSFDWFQGCNTVDDLLVKDTDGLPIWMQYYESRYPDDDNLNALYEAGGKVPYQLYRWLRFCQDCNQHLTESDGTIDLESEGQAGVSGTAANRLKKWQEDLHLYANVHSLICYHVFTDYIAAVDQRSKNMMLGFYLDTDGVMRAYLNHLYDGDTILGSDNDCGLTIPALLDPDTDTGVYQGWDSVLFQRMKDIGSDGIWLDNAGEQAVTVAEVAAAMRAVTTSDGLKPFSPAGLYKYWITDRLSKWPKVVSSFDGERKYIERSTAQANYFYALHGLSIERLQDFIETRFAFRDGHYQCGDLYSSQFSMRCTGTGITIEITAAKDGYFGVGVDRANTATDSCYLKAGESYTLKTGMTNTGSGTMLYIFGADKLGEINISNATPSQQSWDISELTLLKRFIIGGESYTPSENTQGYLTTLNLGNMPFLEELDIRNTKVTSVNARYCPRLKTLRAAGSQLQTLTLAETSPVSVLQLPATMTTLWLVNLSSLSYPGGLSMEGMAGMARLTVGGCPSVDIAQLLSDLSSASAPLRYVRLTDLDITAKSVLLQSLVDNGAIGLDADGNAYGESGQCSGLIGTWTLSDVVADETLSTLKAYFPNLALYNAQYTMIEFDDAIENGFDGNITNLDNGTKDGDSGGYVPSGHISKLKSMLHVYKGTYNESTKKMRLEQLSDSDYTMLKNGGGCDVTDTNGAGYDIFLGLPHYWYKGINDHVNQKKYIAYSTEEAEPRSSARKVSRSKIGSLLYKALSGVYVDNYKTGDVFNANSLTASSANNVYSMDVEGMQQVRWPGINSDQVGALFLAKDGKVVSAVTTYITNSLSDFMQGEYVFCAVPAGAKTFLFTAPVGYDDVECIAVDSAAIEAIEPDWVEHKFELIGTYKGTVDNLMRLRSVSGVIAAGGTGTSVTSNYWGYDNNGNLAVGLPQAGTSMNYTCKDFQNLARCRGEGYQVVDYEQHKDIANLWMAIHGRRNSQSVNGSGLGKTSTGGTDLPTDPSPMRESGNNQRPRTMGLEDWWGMQSEWLDNVAVNVPSYAEFLKNKSEAPAGRVADHVWHIRMPDGSERAVQGVTGNAMVIARVRHGRYCDVVPSKLVNNSSYNTHYCDTQEYNGSTGRCVLRSGYFSSAVCGLVYVYAGCVSSYSNGYDGARLAFRGACEIVE